MAMMSRSAISGLMLALLWAPSSLAQTSPPSRESGPPRIQDNSFLLEEAYNQEDGVIQHISAFSRSRKGDWTYTFTQEWPVFSETHQFSYTIPVQRADEDTGIGDVALNYRYQLVGDGDARVAVAPRLSLLLPTGDEKRGLGMGGLGVQVNVPASIVLREGLVTHVNAGMTYVPSARNADGDRAAATGGNLGQSLVWEVAPRFNALLEAVYSTFESVTGSGRTRREHTFLLSPGIRWAYNFPGGLQIVPGIAVPVGLGPSHGDWSLFLYLSFEHPLWQGKK
jgi:outer membrane putative beta-barrel porin/alpha-amylase